MPGRFTHMRSLANDSLRQQGSKRLGTANNIVMPNARTALVMKLDVSPTIELSYREPVAGERLAAATGSAFLVDRIILASFESDYSTHSVDIVPPSLCILDNILWVLRSANIRDHRLVDKNSIFFDDVITSSTRPD